MAVRATAGGGGPTICVMSACSPLSCSAGEGPGVRVRGAARRAGAGASPAEIRSFEEYAEGFTQSHSEALMADCQR